jgi:type II restriction/modification system DNA methylase subunit YeeA
METAKLERFAKYARRYLLEQVRVKLDKVLATNSDERRRNSKQVQALEDEIKKLTPNTQDLTPIIDKVAYTWFNRFCALRYMDVNNYTKIGIISPLPGQFQPEILAEAKMGHIDEELATKENRQRVFSLLSGQDMHDDPQNEAYRILIISVCNYYAQIMPFLFEKLQDWTELLMPDDLMSDNSILASTREALTPETCQDVEVIGWLYQFYISEKKDDTFAELRKGRKVKPSDIPAVTQLFTPHWIVKYMTQNSLGKLWLNNYPKSTIKSQMEFYIEDDPDAKVDFLKITNPEEIKLCDPSCGSGHILTYAFDLLYEIYSEMGYDPTDISRLIITKNLFGIEIDERAGELAAFALTMKARSKDKLWLKRNIEPQICVLKNKKLTESEIENYMQRCGRDIFTSKLEKTFYQFDNTDTLGSLIIPEEQDFESIYGLLSEKHFEEDVFLSPIHKSILEIIEQADYLSTKYQVVITNPPYMGTSYINENFQHYAKRHYPNSRSDMFAMFIERCLNLTVGKGYIGMITMQSWMFLSSFEKLRKQLIANYDVITMAHLGPRAFDTIGGEVVSTTSFILRKDLPSVVKGTYFRLISGFSEKEKMDLILTAIADPLSGNSYQIASSVFKKIPGLPIAYWATDKVIKAYDDSNDIELIAPVRQGMATGNNEKYVRLWFEVGLGLIGFDFESKESAFQSNNVWYPFNKGGTYRKWYGNNDCILRFDRLAYNQLKQIGNHCPSEDMYFKEMITWTFVSTKDFAARYCNRGFIFGNAGSSCFPETDQFAVLGFLCSKIATELLKISNPTLNYEVGNVRMLPWKSHLHNYLLEAGKICSRIVLKAKNDWDSYETSWDFSELPILSVRCQVLGLRETYSNLRDQWMETTLEVKTLEKENNRIFIEAYGMQGEITPEVPLKEITLTCNPYYRYSVEAEVKLDNHPESPWGPLGVSPGGSQVDTREFPINEQLEKRLLADTMKEFISYSVGCMFGRYSLDKPGLILANQGETIQDYLKLVPKPSFKPDEDNVIPILDDEWFIDDIVARFKDFLKVTFGVANFDENLRFIEEAIDKDIRSFFIKDFYNDHVKRYKKRPIYWLFSSPKGSFNALIYMHRYTPDTISVILNDYLREFVVKLNAKQADLEMKILSSATSQRDKILAGKELDKNKAMVTELENWERDILFKLAATKLEIDLDDGVKVNYAKFDSALKSIQGFDK